MINCSKGSEVIQVLASGSALAPLIEAQWQMAGK